MIFHFFFKSVQYMRVSFSIHALCATKLKTKKTKKKSTIKTVNPYTISGRIEPGALIVSQIVHGSHLRFWRGLYGFWGHLGNPFIICATLKRALPKSKMQSVHYTRQNIVIFFNHPCIVDRFSPKP